MCCALRSQMEEAVKLVHSFSHFGLRPEQLLLIATPRMPGVVYSQESEVFQTSFSALPGVEESDYEPSGRCNPARAIELAR